MSAPDISVAGSLAALYRALVSAGPAGIGSDEAISIVIAAGSSQRDSRLVGWRISKLRDRLKPEGWAIRATGKGGSNDGRFILEPIAAPPAIETVVAPAALLGIVPVERRVYGSAFTSTSEGRIVSLARVSFIDGVRP